MERRAMNNTMNKSYLYLIIPVVFYLVKSAFAHPQCLDFRAPYKPMNNISFCSQYSDLGCCGKSNDDLLEKEYEYIRSKVTVKDWDVCQDYVKELLCQKCSPYAAHIYDAEKSARPRAFPGLCRDYCNDFYDKCHQIVWFFDASLAAATVLGSRKRFCDKVALDDEDYCYPDLLTNTNLNFILSPPVLKNSNPGCLCVKKVGQKLANPLFARPAGDGSGRVFVAEQAGKVYIYHPSQNVWRDEIFLDFTEIAKVSGFPGDERGFFGLAFHPNFSTNGRFFVFYSTNTKQGDVLPPELEGLPYDFRSKTVVSEMKLLPNEPNKADPSFEKVLLEVFQPFANHNGGELFFGVDGYLYTFHGDGGGGGDPLRAAQNKSLLLGKVLRLDVDSDPTQTYTIPSDNPFVGEEGTRPEIYAFGIRNIWRCGLDRGDSLTGEHRGRVLCGDVGQSSYEEIDALKKGANYGWNAREGFECFDENLCGNIGEEELPIAAYEHSVGKSVTGGVFYRGCENPSLNGHYIYGDYQSRQLFSLTSEINGTWTNKNVFLCGDDICQGDMENDVGGKILSFGEDEEGEIYVLTSPGPSSRKKNGAMFKIVDPSTRSDPELCSTDTSNTSRVPLPRRRRIVEIGSGGAPFKPNKKVSVYVRSKDLSRQKKKIRSLKKRRKWIKIKRRCRKKLTTVDKRKCKWRAIRRWLSKRKQNKNAQKQIR